MMGARWRTLARHFLLPGIGTAMLLFTLLWAAYIGAFPVWLVLMMLCSIAILIAGLMFQEAGGLRDSVASMVYSVFVLLAGIGLYLITTNHVTRIDLTEHKINSLSPQSVTMLRLLDREVRVTVFAEARHHSVYRTMFDLYSAETRNLRFAVYDPVAAGASARDFDDSGRILPNTAYAEVFDDNGYRIRTSRFILRPDDPYREHVLSNEIQKAVLGSADRIYFTMGHGERSLERMESQRREAPDISWQQFSLMLEDSILPVERIDLSRTGRVPEDAAALIIASPVVDFNDLERESVIEYINDGGAVMITLDPRFNNPSPMPNLDRILARAGLRVPSPMLMDPNAQRHGLVVVRPAQDHAITEALAEVGFQFDGAREIIIDDSMEHDSPPQIRPILGTPGRVWRLDIERGSRATSPPEGEEMRAAAVGVVSTIPTPSGIRRSTARVAVFGDGDFLSNHRMTQPEVAILGINTVNWLESPENVIAIPPRTIPPSAFDLDVRQFWTMIGLLLLIGFLMLGGGLSYTLARRRMG